MSACSPVLLDEDLQGLHTYPNGSTGVLAPRRESPAGDPVVFHLLGQNEFALRQDFSCGKMLVRRISGGMSEDSGYCARSCLMRIFRASTPTRTAALVSSLIF